MRFQMLALIPLAALAFGTLLPSDAQAAKIPLCFDKQSGLFCSYAVDSSDCIREDGQTYCRTITLYRWDI